MSQARPTTPPHASEGSPVSNLTLVVLLLIPCVVILLLLNCLFLLYKLLVASKKKRRGDAEELLLLPSPLHTSRGRPAAAFSPRPGAAFVSLARPELPRPVTSSRASSREPADHRTRLLRPDGATGSGSLRAPSTIRATSPPVGFSPRLERPPGSRTRGVSRARWCQRDAVLAHTSGSEDTRGNLVPPNSPTQGTEGVCDIHRSSTYEMLTDINPGVAVHVFDKINMEYIDPHSEASCLNTSGLDSDFGASAGVSLRILSADSDGLSNGVLASALEWDYYDPCYVKQNNVPRHKHHRPAMQTKQYWV